MPHITINDKAVAVAPGTMLLAAAEAAGVVVPTLCFRPGYPHVTSCMLCVVQDMASGRLLPACSAVAADGQRIATDTAEVHDARRTALELLLSDHLGDCEGPCHRVCPAHLNIPRMLRQIAAGRFADALVTVKHDIPLPAVLGRICPAPCEKACRRGAHDGTVAICLLKRFVADIDLALAQPFLPLCRPASGKNVAIVGAGPAGLSAAYYLTVAGHACTVFDAQPAPGGMLRYGITPERLPPAVLDAEIAQIVRMGVRFQAGVTVGREMAASELRNAFAAVLIAAGDGGGGLRALFGIAGAGKEAVHDIHTGATSVPGVFAAGAVVRPGKMAVTAVGAGKSVAAAVDQFLMERPVTGEPRRFQSVIGRLLEGELAEIVQAEADPAAPAQSAPVDAAPTGRGLTPDEAIAASRRCLHCDCRKPDSCKLRVYAEQYSAHAQRYKGKTRRRFRQLRQHAAVVYEPGKCIRCGLCVRITEKAREPLGLTFVGRGFAVEVRVPFNDTLALGLQKTAAACVAACPTGALACGRGDAGR